MIKKNGYIVWPIYFDKNVPRSKCRRVPLSLAVKNPSIENIVKAAESLGWKVEVETAAYPSMWWLKTGRAIIKPDKPMSKNSLIKTLAQRLKILSP
ncbi:MAG: signal recognition particle protein Srp19 [Aigarchaeota archaeon]|nr:signal recognition particle protein Srp19 [Aigarchaeota archaeon]MCX8193385.1 signal recognition particle protein Srp19 [Nitrososphaeria archaeon]MDW7985915.1 signal recognition particle subunit SRP19/SEC65 family protein [Nitrososphaerota archaeon]